MPPQENAIVLINLTPKQPKIRGLELSTIRSHNAIAHRSKRGRPRQRPKSVDEDLAQVVARRSQADHPGLHRLPSESIRSDPFDSYPVHTNELFSQAIDHCKRNLVKHVLILANTTCCTDTTVIASFYGPYLSSTAGTSNGCLDVLLPQAISNEYFFHVTVAISRTIQLMAQGESAQHDGVVTFHRGQALVGIKAALADIDDDLLPMAVMHMVSLDVSSVRHHGMVKNAGGKTPLSDYANTHREHG